MSESNSELLVVLAPVGAGKSTFVKLRRSRGEPFSHIDRDRIANKILDAHGIRMREAMDEVNAELCRRLFVGKALPAYYNNLDTELRSRSPKVVVDFPTGGSTECLEGTLKRGRAAGRRVLVEGIYADPERSLPPTLTRDTYGMEPEEAGALASNKTYLTRWLATFQRFPGQLTEAIRTADGGRLYDNNTRSGTDPRVIAEWPVKTGAVLPIIHDHKAYNAFLKLSSINVQNLPTVRLIDSNIQADDWCHVFNVRPNYVGQPIPTRLPRIDDRMA